MSNFFLMPFFILYLQPLFCYFIILNLISVFVQIFSPHCERNSAYIVRRFLTSFRFALNIVAHNMEGKSKNSKYVHVQIFSQILKILLLHSIQFLSPSCLGSLRGLLGITFVSSFVLALPQNLSIFRLFSSFLPCQRFYIISYFSH